MDSRTRSLAKTLSWRILAILITTLVAWSIAGEVRVAVAIGAGDTALKMNACVRVYPALRVFGNDEPIPLDLHWTDPDRCCEFLKVQPTRRAIAEMGVSCWATGLRCTEGRTRTDFQEIERRDEGLIKLNPILVWHEREVWQYLAVHRVPVHPLYAKGYRSLGCEPCTRIVAGPHERGGRWSGTSKCGGECGIHTRPLLRGSEVKVQ